MKISYRTHPVLANIKKGPPETKIAPSCIIGIDKTNVTAFFDLYDHIWHKLIKQIKTPIFIMANTFASAVEGSRKKLYQAGLIDEIKNTSGILCWNDLTLLYEVRQTKDRTWLGNIMAFLGNNLYFLYSNDMAVYISSGFKITPDEVGGGYLDIILSTELFKRYAEIETKILPPNSKQKTGKNKYINDTNVEIIHLDSKWFTTLVKSDAFKVRGHFRLQPFGEGLKDRKLIWINEFQKEGYTAPARKLSSEL